MIDAEGGVLRSRRSRRDILARGAKVADVIIEVGTSKPADLLYYRRGKVICEGIEVV